ncbi:unnamed protein product [Arctia plantaginis]|uniref:Uncharacterized protein n=1 Tax=Arctia plantaginis TaxID=874455 RepID=A0A8S0ZBU9_ARCPL|nr:unnamed protein product [Arctia plantaginis]CAB3234463.1 unnamed protein product [Arctia plantaginis]
MEALKSDPPKLPDMVMCGDHPSFIKSELNVNMDGKEKEKLKDKNVLSYAKISPTTSHTEGPTESRARLTSEHALRRRVRELERDRPDLAPLAPARPDRPAAQVFPFGALGSFRWPPYILAVWVLVLVLTHVLHCLVSVLGRALPVLKKCTQYFRTWSEETWNGQTDLNQKLVPVGLAAITAMLYCVYFALYIIYGVVVWSVEPLCSDVDENRSSIDLEAKVVDYIEDSNSKTNSNIKP